MKNGRKDPVGEVNYGGNAGGSATRAVEDGYSVFEVVGGEDKKTRSFSRKCRTFLEKRWTFSEKSPTFFCVSP